MLSPSRHRSRPALLAAAGLDLVSPPVTVPHAAGQESCRPDRPVGRPCPVREPAGQEGDGVTRYGLPTGTTLIGTCARKCDATPVAPRLWNAERKVFPPTEDERSVRAEADHVVDRGIGGTMIREPAGDHGWNAAEGRYEPGSTLTTARYGKSKSASPYGAKRSSIDPPAEALAVDVEFGQFPLSDSAYPVSPRPRITNRPNTTLPGGTEFRSGHGTSAPGNAKDQSGWGTSTIRGDRTGADAGGPKGDRHRVPLRLPGRQTPGTGAWAEPAFVYRPCRHRRTGR